MIEAIIFDLEDTLIDTSSYRQRLDMAMYELIARELGCDLDSAQKLFENRRKSFPTTTATVENLGIEKELFHKTLENVSLACVDEIEGARKLLEQLSKSHYKVGLLTNIPRKLALNLLDQSGISTECFDAIITGTDTERPKPSMEPFLKITRELRVSPGNCVMVGDREDVDLSPAKDIGMVTILLGNHSSTVDYCINDLCDLVGCVNGHSEHSRQEQNYA